MRVNRSAQPADEMKSGETETWTRKGGSSSLFPFLQQTTECELCLDGKTIRSGWGLARRNWRPLGLLPRLTDRIK